MASPAPSVVIAIAVNMEAIQNALNKRWTCYKNVPAPVLAQLESLAAQHGKDAPEIANLLDKFMTTSGWGPLADRVPLLHILSSYTAPWGSVVVNFPSWHPAGETPTMD